MSDVEIRFEREGLSGIVAVGSRLIDTIRRFGVNGECKYDQAKGIHECGILIITGSDILSPLTSTEREHFSRHGRRSSERLACEARIIKPGEITLMTDQKKEEPKNKESAKDRFQQEFDALPLEKKIASLFRMEAVTLSETFAYVVKTPLKVVEKVGDIIADFGTKIENEAKKAAQSAGSKTTSGTTEKPGAKPGGRAQKRTPDSRASKG